MSSYAMKKTFAAVGFIEILETANPIIEFEDNEDGVFNHDYVQAQSPGF